MLYFLRKSPADLSWLAEPCARPRLLDSPCRKQCYSWTVPWGHGCHGNDAVWFAHRSIYIYININIYIYIILYLHIYIYYIYIGKSGTKFKVGQWVSQECMQRLVWSISKSYMLYYAILAGWYFHPPFFSAYKSWMMIPLDFEICDEWLNHQTRHSIYMCVCMYLSI